MTPLRIGIVEDDDRLRADLVRLIDDCGDMRCVGAYRRPKPRSSTCPRRRRMSC
jgi:hypothetical protein